VSNNTNKVAHQPPTRYYYQVKDQTVIVSGAQLYSGELDSAFGAAVSELDSMRSSVPAAKKSKKGINATALPANAIHMSLEGR
jgi:hypothetical protein